MRSKWWQGVMVAVLSLATGGCSTQGHSKTQPTSPAPSTVIGSALASSGILGDRAFDLADLKSVLTGLPQIAKMPQVDAGDDATLLVPGSCAREGGTTFGTDSWIEYEQDDPAASDLVVELGVAQLASADQVKTFFSTLKDFISSCSYDPLAPGRNSGGVKGLQVAAPSGASQLVIDEYSGAGSIHDAAEIGSGRVVLSVFVKKYDHVKNESVSPDVAATKEVIQELFAKYVAIHASAPLPG